MADLSFLNEIPDPLVPDAAAAAGELGVAGAPPLDLGSTHPEPNRVLSEQPEAAGEVPAWVERLPAAASRAEVQRRRLLALLLSASWVGVHLLIYGVRADVQRLPVSYLLAHIGWPLLLSIVSLGVALAKGPRGLGLPVVVLAALAVLGPLSFAALSIGVHAPPRMSSPLSLVSIWVCFDITLVCSALPLVVAAWSLRKAFAAASSLRALLVGVAAGAFSAAMLNLHCENVEPLHMLLGHAAPTFLLAAVGAWGLSRVFRV